MSGLIKYFGGKTLMISELLKLCPKSYSIYCEPFGGSASLLLAQERNCVEIYNDLSSNVYSLFKVISDTQLFNEFKRKLDLTYYHENIRREFKQLLKTDTDILDRAYHFFYVNKTSFNSAGGFSVSGVIRRKMSKSTSDYLSSVDGLPYFHDRLSRVVCTQKDAFEVIQKYNDNDTFMYLDPPYIHETRSSSARYEHEMTDEQHEELVRLCLKSRTKIMLSCYDHKIYEPLLEKFTKINGLNNRGSYKECIYVNYLSNEDW